MSVFDSRNDFGTASQEEAKWIKLNADHGGRLEERARELLRLLESLTLLDVRIKILAEEKGWNAGTIAEFLGIEEQTIYNHASKMRKLAGVDRKARFRSVFPPPPSEFE